MKYAIVYVKKPSRTKRVLKRFLLIFKGKK